MSKDVMRIYTTDLTSDFNAFDDISAVLFKTTWKPQTGESNGVRFAVTGWTSYEGDYDITGNGHSGGVIGIGQVNSIGKHEPLKIGVEGRAGVVEGTADIVCGVLGTLDRTNENNGTATLAAQFYAPPISAADAAHYTYPFAIYAPGKDLDSRIDARLLLGIGGSTERGTAPVTANSAIGLGLNSGTNETDLHSYTLPADSLSRNGNAVRFRACGYTANNSNTKTIKVYFGASTVLTYQFAVDVVAVYDLEMIVVRESSGQQRAVCTLKTTGAAGVAVMATGLSSPTHNEATNCVIKTTGQGGASNDIIELFAVTEFLN